MKNWKKVMAIGWVLGIVASVYALNVNPQLSAPAMFTLILIMGFSAQTVWDMVLFGDVDTRDEIINKRNVAYAITLCIPALLVLAAALVK
ncbi:MAG: hypothetical protein JSS89_13300 [Bacteroidetes bacterium]|nr:hypothetical protein [Bacteroidota bacterium]